MERVEADRLNIFNHFKKPLGDFAKALPRPGCGVGNLDWEIDVKPIILQYLNTPNLTIFSL